MKWKHNFCLQHTLLLAPYAVHKILYSTGWNKDFLNDEEINSETLEFYSSFMPADPSPCGLLLHQGSQRELVYLLNLGGRSSFICNQIRGADIQNCIHQKQQNLSHQKFLRTVVTSVRNGAGQVCHYFLLHRCESQHLMYCTSLPEGLKTKHWKWKIL